MKEKTICVATPVERTYYKAVPLAKEFLDKENNVVNTIGVLPEGEVTVLNVSAATVKRLHDGKPDGKVEVINLSDNRVTYSEEYKDGHLVSLHKSEISAAPALKSKEKTPAQIYTGTVLKTSKGTNSFYVNGQKVAEETISSNGATLEILGNIPDGEVKEFDENGQLKTRSFYQGSKLNGETLRYAEDGNLVSRENYADGFLQGPAEYYTQLKTEKLVAKCFYKNSRLEGERTLSRENGVVIQRETYKGGRLNGSRESYYGGGAKECEEHFSDGKLHGSRELFFPNGKIWYRENYANGRLEGDRQGFFPGGQIYLEEFYADGMLEGPRVIYSENGDVLVNEEYHWGALVQDTERKE